MKLVRLHAAYVPGTSTYCTAVLGRCDNLSDTAHTHYVAFTVEKLQSV